VPVEVGFVGLGVMGSAMSGHLLGAGFPVVGFDVDDVRLREHRERGGLIGTSAAEVAGRSDVVVTSLPSTSAFEDVVDGILDGAGSGLIVVETSTLPLEIKQAARHRLGERGVTLLDCPLSGTGAQARDKDLVVFVSGDEPAAKERIKAVLDGFARAHHDVGEFGNGTKMKIVANLLVAVHNVAAAEALLLARRAGLDPDLTLRAVADGAGSSRMLEIRGPMMISGDYDEATMRVEVFRKDLDIITSFARSLHSPAPLLAASTAFYDAALAQGRADQDTACVFAVLERLAGES
jgi:putative dehydrogenase